MSHNNTLRVKNFRKQYKNWVQVVVQINSSNKDDNEDTMIEQKDPHNAQHKVEEEYKKVTKEIHLL